MMPIEHRKYIRSVFAQRPIECLRSLTAQRRDTWTVVEQSLTECTLEEWEVDEMCLDIWNGIMEIANMGSYQATLIFKTTCQLGSRPKMWFSLSDELTIHLPNKLLLLGKVVEQNLDFQRMLKDPMYEERLDRAYKTKRCHAHEVVHGIILKSAESKGIPVAVLKSKEDESGCIEWSYMFDWSDPEKESKV